MSRNAPLGASIVIDLTMLMRQITVKKEQVMSNKMTAEQELASLKKQNAELQAKLEKKNTMSCKVSAKGAVSVYGMGRFPVTLYMEQWQRIEEFLPELMAFVKVNRSKLSVKE